MANFGKLFIVSGPAGVGKTTVVNALLAHVQDGSLERSITVTTRFSRQNEVNGKHYHFLLDEEFQEGIGNDLFLEYALVHNKYYYGSLRDDVMGKISSGIDVILVIDVQGFLQILNKNLGIEIVSVFIKPEKLQVLEERMRRRGSESEQEIKGRLQSAEEEISFANRYKYVIISSSRERDFYELLKIYTEEKHENNGR
ncbi:MAG: guanylate kinase [Puniceicoccales bacterium]|jgi:guanylate kinase|nr:guanylate kinase [Puniceicoccales bacterium]